MHKYRLPAEWERQSHVQLTLSNLAQSWYSDMPEIEGKIIELAHIIASDQQVMLVTPELERISEQISNPNIQLVKVETNDIWTRDHGLITLVGGSDERRYLDFTFNGWGEKFPAELDNKINSQLLIEPIEQIDFVLEGGSIESNGQGTILTTESCLLTDTRNPKYSKEQIESLLKEKLHLDQVIWLKHGHLAGDDTDGHIDMLARFCKPETVAYTSCDNPEDEHYQELSLMREELEQTGYDLIPLPIPAPIYSSEGQRLPASYANFLITNSKVIVPVYDDPNDQMVCRRLAEAFSGREIVPFDSRAFIEGYGSIHCISMNFPL